jgi:hypothetical protein
MVSGLKYFEFAYEMHSHEAPLSLLDSIIPDMENVNFLYCDPLPEDESIGKFTSCSNEMKKKFLFL